MAHHPENQTYGPKLCLWSLILLLLTKALEASQTIPPGQSPFLTPLFPLILDPENPSNRTILTLFYTGKITAVLLLALGTYSLAKIQKTPPWINLLLCLPALGIILHPTLLYPSLVTPTILTLLALKPKTHT
jgi:hypothetical protein